MIPFCKDDTGVEAEADAFLRGVRQEISDHNAGATSGASRAGSSHPSSVANECRKLADDSDAS